VLDPWTRGPRHGSQDAAIAPGQHWRWYPAAEVAARGPHGTGGSRRQLQSMSPLPDPL